MTTVTSWVLSYKAVFCNFQSEKLSTMATRLMVLEHLFKTVCIQPQVTNRNSADSMCMGHPFTWAIGMVHYLAWEK